MTKPGSAIICNFDSSGNLEGRKRTYKTVKAAVLEAGRFSVFEATQDMKSARIFTKMNKDPEIEIFDLPYPWIGVRKKV